LPTWESTTWIAVGASALAVLLFVTTVLLGLGTPTATELGGTALVIAGLLVGFGTRLGSGCTSGHGVCGVARLSPRSIVATMVFMGVAIAVVAVTRHGLGG